MKIKCTVVGKTGRGLSENRFEGRGQDVNTHIAPVSPHHKTL